jgi:hypothetical protein
MALLPAPFRDLSRWFNKRLEHRAFGELRDQLVAEFPEEEGAAEHSDGFVEGAGHGVLNDLGGCGSGSFHMDADPDEILTRMNTQFSQVNPYGPTHPGEVFVLLNDCDADSHPMTSWVSSYPLHGDLVLHQNGGVIYTPDDGYIGADMFWYYIIDGYGYNSAAPVSILVYDPDIDVDSNNQAVPGDVNNIYNGIDPDNSQSGTDDKIEFNSSLPGKILALNDDDDNQNGVADYLDAPFRNATGRRMVDDDLVPVKLSVPLADTFLKDLWLTLDFVDFSENARTLPRYH